LVCHGGVEPIKDICFEFPQRSGLAFIDDDLGGASLLIWVTAAAEICCNHQATTSGTLPIGWRAAFCFRTGDGRQAPVLIDHGSSHCAISAKPEQPSDTTAIILDHPNKANRCRVDACAVLCEFH
jgi:hypothetical protein